MSQKILAMSNIHKSFGSLEVLKGVHLNIYSGEVMALMGENGAGKSTLIKILAGIEFLNEGEIILHDSKYKPTSVLDSEKQGIVVIHQELNLFDELNVLDNVFFGNELMKNALEIDYNKQIESLNEIFKVLNISIPYDTLVKDLSIGQKQLIEITKALRKKAKILVMDEPTSALSEDEIENIFAVIETLKKQGTAIVYISHRMQEIYRICDKVTILRDGAYFGEHLLKDLSEDKLIELMVGREVTDPFPYLKVEDQKEWLKVENLNSDFVRDVSFTLKRGEILGVGGLMGSGRTSLAHLLYGTSPIKSGSIHLDGKKISITHPEDALKHNIVYVSEDRKGNGLWLDFSIGKNITMSALNLFVNKMGKIDNLRESNAINEFMKMTGVKASDSEITVSSLSGGNQQKVAIARALLLGPIVLILDEPTRGIDIGARREIYTLINEFKRKGVAVILISSDMPELLSLSDRVLVMSEGKMTGILDYEEKSPENIMKLAVNIKE